MDVHDWFFEGITIHIKSKQTVKQTQIFIPEKVGV